MKIAPPSSRRSKKVTANLNGGFTIHVTKNGEITFPPGCNDIWDAQRKVNQKLEAIYMAKLDAERKHQLEAARLIKERQRQEQVAKDAIKLEKLCLCEAMVAFEQWDARIAHMKRCGYEYYKGNVRKFKTKMVHDMERLKKRGQWDELIKEVVLKGVREQDNKQQEQANVVVWSCS